MIKMIYDRKCAFRPKNLGMCIAKMIQDKIISENSKFISFMDIVSKDEKDNSHIPIMHFIDDMTNEITDLPTVSTIASKLIIDDETEKECQKEEGCAVISVEKSIFEKYKPDNRMRFIRLDYEKFNKYMSECIDLSEIAFQYDAGLEVYFTLKNVNMNGINSFNEKGIDYKEFHKQSEDKMIASYINKHYPDKFGNLKFVSDVVDTNHESFDNRDNVKRRMYKTYFRLFDNDNKPVILDGIEKVKYPSIGNHMTCENLKDILLYFTKTGILFDDEVVLGVYRLEKDSAFPIMVKFKRGYELTNEENDEFLNCKLRKCIDYLNKEDIKDKECGQFSMYGSLDDIMTYLNRDEVKSKMKDMIEFFPLDINQHKIG